MNNRGQGLIELVLAIGVIGLVITGVISLMATSLHSRTVGFDRKKASELGQIEIERLVEKKNQDPVNFWNKSPTVWSDYDNSPRSDSYYVNYFYKKNVNWNVVNSIGETCNNCIEATVSIGWSGSGVGETITFTRLFSKN